MRRWTGGLIFLGLALLVWRRLERYAGEWTGSEPRDTIESPQRPARTDEPGAAG